VGKNEKKKLKMTHASHMTIDLTPLTDEMGKNVIRLMFDLSVIVGSSWGKVSKPCSSWGQKVITPFFLLFFQGGLEGRNHDSWGG
jgi:hypothetical protein